MTIGRLLYQIVIHTALAASLYYNFHYAPVLKDCLQKEYNQQQTVDKIRVVNDLIGESTRNSAASYHYAELYIKAGKEFNIDPTLLAVVGKFESGFNPSIESYMGAIGIQQIMPFWAQKIPFIKSVQDLYDPALNIRASAYILSHYRELCGSSVESMATCYHGGPGAMRNPKPSTTKFKSVVSNLFYEIKATTYAESI